MVALAPNTSETSPWDVLDTFPKLHSRAREAKTSTCTEAPHSKSRSGIEIWLTIYDCRDGLESFTRDPIGYRESNDVYLYVLSNPIRFVDPSGLECHPENHHWFPRAYKGAIETKCSSIGFRIDHFTTPLNKCKDEDKNCSVHGWIHGNSLPDRPIRSPDWNTEVGEILGGTGTCCAFRIEMAAAIAVAYAEIADEFADCDQPKCYKLETFRLPHNPEHRPRPDTTRLFSDIVAACRRGQQPDRLPENVNEDGGGLGYDPTIDILVGGGGGLLPKVLPKVFPRVLPKVIPKDPIKKFPELIPRRRAG